MSALISIITITRNRASLIHRCIESIQKQTYRHYEHLIIDGNSEDNTEAVVNAYAVSDSHIKYIKLDKNHPIPQTYLIAYKACKGDYITSLDDDDEYYPNKIEQQLH
ncbi:MAG: glycosyltransferase family 2 protein, partial [Muribaculaceae bacterium]